MSERVFAADVIDAVLAHMNDDHRDDSLLIVRAFAEPTATAATMTGLNEEAGEWTAVVDGRDRTCHVRWPGGPISERAEIRREVVVLYDEACARLGVAARPH